MDRQLVGLSGYAQSGKDTLASYMVEHMGYVQLAFADKLREVVRAIDPVIDYVHPIYDKDGDTQKSPRPVRVSDLWDEIGYERLKAEYPEFRAILQRVGTEAGRKIIDDNLWVDLTMKTVAENPDQKFVITDARFPNEGDAIKKAGGVIVRIKRNGYGPINNHISETALDDYPFDAVIRNDGTLADFFEEACVTISGL